MDLTILKMTCCFADERPVSRNSGGDFILQLQQENEALRRELDLKVKLQYLL